MIALIVVLFWCIKIGELAPVQFQQIQQQQQYQPFGNSPYKYFYPNTRQDQSYQQAMLQMPQQQLPISQGGYNNINYENLLSLGAPGGYQNINFANIGSPDSYPNYASAVNPIMFRQNSPIPFLPIQINIPDLITNIVRKIREIFPNLPILGGLFGSPSANPSTMATKFQPPYLDHYFNSESYLDNNQKFSSNPYILPIPIVFIIPQQYQPSATPYEATEKTTTPQ